MNNKNSNNDVTKQEDILDLHKLLNNGKKHTAQNSDGNQKKEKFNCLVKKNTYFKALSVGKNAFPQLLMCSIHNVLNCRPFFEKVPEILNFSFDDGVLTFNIDQIFMTEMELKVMYSDTNSKKTHKGEPLTLPPLPPCKNILQNIKVDFAEKKEEFKHLVELLLKHYNITSTQEPLLESLKIHFSRLGSIVYDLPEENQPVFDLTFNLIWRKMLFSSLINIKKINFRPHCFRKPVVSFQSIFEFYFKRKCSKSHLFIYKLYNMLKITSYYPEFYSILGIIWVNKYCFKVNINTFGKAVNNSKSNSSLFNNSGMFAQYKFIELTKSDIDSHFPEELISDVDFTKVRILTDSRGTFSKYSEPDFNDYTFDRNSKLY